MAFLFISSLTRFRFEKHPQVHDAWSQTKVFFGWKFLQTPKTHALKRIRFFGAFPSSLDSWWWLCLAARWNWRWVHLCGLSVYGPHHSSSHLTRSRSLSVVIHVMKLVDEISLEALTFVAQQAFNSNSSLYKQRQVISFNFEYNAVSCWYAPRRHCCFVGRDHWERSLALEESELVQDSLIPFDFAFKRRMKSVSAFVHHRPRS